MVYNRHGLIGDSDAHFGHRGQGQLTELVRRAEAGDEVILTRHGYAAVRRRRPAEIADVTAASARRIASAYETGGKGVHPAGLNLGDCFAYEAAKARGCRLLYVGDDFARMDVNA